MKKTKEEVFELDFSQVTENECPVGEAAFNSEKVDYGGFGKNTDYYKDGSLTINWKGTTATVTGELNYLKPSENGITKLTKDGHYFAFALMNWFKDKQVTVKINNTKTSKETDWVCFIENNNTPIVITYNDTLIATFDLSKVVLGIKS